MRFVKSKDKYSWARWQIDAHGFARSNGDRLITPEELIPLKWGVIYRMFRAHSLTKVYDYDEHVRVGETLDNAGRLRVDFMLLPPQSWHPDIWTHVTRMRTLPEISQFGRKNGGGGGSCSLVIS